MLKYYKLTDTLHKNMICKSDGYTHYVYNIFTSNWEPTVLLMFEYFNTDSSYYGMYNEISETEVQKLIDETHKDWVNSWEIARNLVQTHYKPTDLSPISTMNLQSYSIWLSDNAKTINERFIYALKGLKQIDNGMTILEKSGIVDAIVEQVKLYASQSKKLFYPIYTELLRSEVDEIQMLLARPDVKIKDKLNQRMVYIKAHLQ